MVLCAEPLATVDGYCLEEEMTHASRLDGTTWSSKLGSLMRMTHPRYGLNQSESYGNVILRFRPRPKTDSGPSLTVAGKITEPGADTDIKAASGQIVSESVTAIRTLVQRSAENFPVL